MSVELLARALKTGAQRGQNAVFCPVSLQIVLSMLYYATSADGRAALEEHGLDLSAAKMAALRALALKTCNMVGYQTGEVSPPTEGYGRVLWAVFEAQAKAMDFRGDPGGVAAEINTFVAQATEGMIPEAISSDDLAAALVLFLNTTYLKAEWEEQFDPERSFCEPFYGPTGGEQSSVYTMHGDPEVPYCAGNGFQSVQLPRSDGGTVQIVLPAEGVRMEEMLDRLQEVVSARHSITEVNLAMPRLAIEGKTDCGALLGISSVDLEAFSTAELPMVIQQTAKVELDEEGVRAAACTFAIAMGDGETVSMRVDRPFLLLIRERDGTVSFGAVVYNP